MNRAELRQRIVNSFNLSELHTLCFDNSIPYENIRNTTLDDLARELILYFERHSSIEKLEQICRAARPLTFTLPSQDIADILSHWNKEKLCLLFTQKTQVLCNALREESFVYKKSAGPFESEDRLANALRTEKVYSDPDNIQHNFFDDDQFQSDFILRSYTSYTFSIKFVRFIAPVEPLDQAGQPIKEFQIEIDKALKNEMWLRKFGHTERFSGRIRAYMYPKETFITITLMIGRRNYSTNTMASTLISKSAEVASFPIRHIRGRHNEDPTLMGKVFFRLDIASFDRLLDGARNLENDWR